MEEKLDKKLPRALKIFNFRHKVVKSAEVGSSPVYSNVCLKGMFLWLNSLRFNSTSEIINASVAAHALKNVSTSLVKFVYWEVRLSVTLVVLLCIGLFVLPFFCLCVFHPVILSARPSITLRLSNDIFWSKSQNLALTVQWT